MGRLLRPRLANLVRSGRGEFLRPSWLTPSRRHLHRFGGLICRVNKGGSMPKYLCSAAYSSASWARMIRVSEDRAKAVEDLLGSLGGSLDSTYWEVSARSVVAV